MRRTGVAVVASIFLLSTFVIVSGIAQTRPTADEASVLNVAAKTAVKWNFAKAKTADVTCDGKPDRVVFGVSEKKVWVGLIPGGGRAQAGSFPMQVPNQDAFCDVPKYMNVSPLRCETEASGKLDGCRQVRGCKEFAVDGGDCDNFHFYWNSRDHRLSYWRL